jgi:glycosyltransferase involved in cell wall biosynthesis
MAIIDVIIPVFNEERSVGKVIEDLPQKKVREVVVVNNGSLDASAAVAGKAGATVLSEPQKGYGKACLTGIHYLANKKDPPQIVVFLDGDYSDHPEELSDLVVPIENGNADLVIGSRLKGNAEPGALLPQARFGNTLATTLIKWIYGYQFTDLGPFRAIKWHKLLALGMKDEDFGWTVEMQVKAAKKKLICQEVPVSYRKRVGVSKVTGTLKGTFSAGYKILYTIIKELPQS